MVPLRGRQLPAPPQQYAGVGKGLGGNGPRPEAIAEKRGWNHNSHGLIVDIAKQVADEQGRADLLPLFGVAQALHVNFYENRLSSEST